MAHSFDIAVGYLARLCPFWEDRDRGSIDLTSHDLAQFLPSEASGLEYRWCAHNASINLRRRRTVRVWFSNFLHIGALAAAARSPSMSS
jgi:hypothetical protein